jgi:hypothetical protein
VSAKPTQAKRPPPEIRRRDKIPCLSVDYQSVKRYMPGVKPRRIGRQLRGLGHGLLFAEPICVFSQRQSGASAIRPLKNPLLYFPKPSRPCPAKDSQAAGFSRGAVRAALKNSAFQACEQASPYQLVVLSAH